MVRRPRLIASVALLGVLTMLALPTSGSALLQPISIFLTANGPSPAVQTIPAGLWPIWVNQDTVAHTVTFAEGCSIQVAPGGQGQCVGGLSLAVGNHPYTVDGTTQATVVVSPMGRRVTLGARSHEIRRGTQVMLHGRLAVGFLSPPPCEGPRMPVTVLARPDRYHPFHRIAVVTAKPVGPRHGCNPTTAHSAWHLRVWPRAHTIFIVEANSQPAGGQFWRNARSRPFRVRVVR
jgi:hypothetical protein